LLPVKTESNSPISKVHPTLQKRRLPLNPIDNNSASSNESGFENEFESSSNQRSCTSSSSQRSQDGRRQIEPSLEPEFVLDYNKGIKIVADYDTIQRQGVAMFNYLWADELKKGDFDDNAYNVYGTSSNGSNATKRPLNASKVASLRAFMEQQMPHSTNKAKMWSEIVNAIHKRLSYLGSR